MSYRTLRVKYGAIKRGQIWEKIDTQRVMQIRRKNKWGWTVRFIDRARGTVSHTIPEQTIYKFYRPVPKEEARARNDLIF